MATSVTRQAIAASSKCAHTLFLRAAGFKRERNHFHRVVPGLIHGIAFQGSQWGTLSDGSFTINLVVTSALLSRAVSGLPLPSNPATANPPIRVRLGHLMPSKTDSWWSVGADTDLDVLAKRVAECLRQFAMPFFESVLDENSLLNLLREGGDLPFDTREEALMVHAILAAQVGIMAEAREVLSRMLTDPDCHPHGVRLVADRIGVKLE